MALITQAEFARQLEVSKPYIHKLVKKGIIKLRNGKVDTEQALASMKANADPANLLREESPSTTAPVPAGGNPAGAVDFVTARTMREAFKAKLAQLEYEEKSKKLTDASKVSADAFKAGRLLRDELLAIPDRLADVLAAEDDPGEVQKVLLEELELVLNRISNQG